MTLCKLTHIVPMHFSHYLRFCCLLPLKVKRNTMAPGDTRFYIGRLRYVDYVIAYPPSQLRSWVHQSFSWAHSFWGHRSHWVGVASASEGQGSIESCRRSSPGFGGGCSCLGRELHQMAPHRSQCPSPGLHQVSSPSHLLPDPRTRCPQHNRCE